MKHTTKFALAALLLLVMMPAHAQRTDRAKRIGGRMWCMCGCRQILTQCNHVGCSVSTAMLKKLDQLVERNEPDDLVIQAFVQEYGPAVLAEPPAKGAALMGYVMPGVALLGGLGLVLIVLRQWRRGGAATQAPGPESAGPGVSAELLERARRKADAETDDWGGR
jgi:cytochrome c-type biogenesis protein CcmH